MINKQSLKRLLHWLGGGLALLSVAFVGVRLQSYWLDLNFSKIDYLKWIFIGVFSFVYGLTNVFLALAWRDLLRFLGIPFPTSKSIRIYGISQLAKYAPGNILHLASRQALGMAAGIPAGKLIKSMIFELGLMATTGGLFFILALPQIFPYLPDYIGLISFVITLALFGWLVMHFMGLKVVHAFMLQAAFLLVSGVIFAGLIFLISENKILEFWYFFTIIGAYVLAWLLGLITPGAPAGIGVRELVLLLLLNGVFAEADLLIAVLMGRLVSVAGDIIFFLFSFLIPTKSSDLERISA